MVFYEEPLLHIRNTLFYHSCPIILGRSSLVGYGLRFSPCSLFEFQTKLFLIIPSDHGNSTAAFNLVNLSSLYWRKKMYIYRNIGYGFVELICQRARAFLQLLTTVEFFVRDDNIINAVLLSKHMAAFSILPQLNTRTLQALTIPRTTACKMRAEFSRCKVAELIDPSIDDWWYASL